jgi:Uma2 family endonuclease
MNEGSAAVNLPGTVTVPEYLDGETRSEGRHEFSDGLVTAMAGASRRHERVSMNLSSRIFNHLRGQPCEVFKSDMKLRLEIYGRTFFLYPDIMVSCDPFDGDAQFLTAPKLIIEVLSDNEVRDRVEKFLMCQRIQTLEEYAVISQWTEKPEVTVFRRANGWEPGETHTAGEVTFESIGLTIRVKELYSDFQ